MIKRYYFISTQYRLNPYQDVCGYRIFYHTSWFEDHMAAFNMVLKCILESIQKEKPEARIEDIVVKSFNKVR